MLYLCGEIGTPEFLRMSSGELAVQGDDEVVKKPVREVSSADEAS